MSAASTLALMRLASPALPVGGFSYSRGLEAAVAAGWVHDEGSASEWIVGVLEHALCPLDAAVLCRLHDAWSAGDGDAVLRWTHLLRASRESAELLLEDEQMGLALARLLLESGERRAAIKQSRLPASFTCMFALAAVSWLIDIEDALLGLLWSATEGQVGAALRLLPLGQTAGQRMLVRAQPAIARCAARARSLADDEIGNFTPGHALASAWHETQYSRLFRS
jgi:urease accessory protein